MGKEFGVITEQGFPAGQFGFDKLTLKTRKIATTPARHKSLITKGMNAMFMPFILLEEYKHDWKTTDETYECTKDLAHEYHFPAVLPHAYILYFYLSVHYIWR
jgi:hypothetical protein